MNTAIIILGSNYNANQHIDLAKEKLSEYYEIVSSSTCCVSSPVGKHYKDVFYNEAVKLLSDETAEETRANFKQIEIDLGRSPESKKSGIVPIDIDLIFWNEVLVHTDYERFEFVRKCIDEIK